MNNKAIYFFVTICVSVQAAAGEVAVSEVEDTSQADESEAPREDDSEETNSGADEGSVPDSDEQPDEGQPQEAAQGEVQEEGFQCPQKPVDENEARVLAGQFFSKGEQSFKEERFHDALQEFLCSLKLQEHDNTLFNIAHVASRVEDIEAVHTMLSDYLSDAPDNDTTHELGKILNEVEAMSGLGVPVEEKTVPEVQIEEPPPQPEPVVEDEDKGSRRRTMKIIGWTSIGTGAASLIAAAVMQGLAVSAKNDALDATSYDVFRDEKDKNKGLQTGATVGFIAGGLLGGMGLTMLLLSSAGETDASVGVSIVPTTDGLMLKGYF